MKPEISAEFCITGTQLDPNELSNLMGITPTRIWKTGESIQGTAKLQEENGWCLSAGRINDWGLAAGARQLLETLLPKSKILNQVCSQYGLNCELSFAVYVVDETPEINFSQDIISDLTELNASIDIDVILTK